MFLPSIDAGVYAGVGAAALMACSYLSSGWALRRTPGLTSVGLFFNALMGMTLVSLAGIWFVWDKALLLRAGAYLPALLATVFAYGLGQCLIFLAQRDIDASRIVPLLGLKLPMLALLNLVVFRQHFSLLQLLAIALTVLAAFVLNNAGHRIGWLNMSLVLAGCCAYCLSDTFIRVMVQRMQGTVYDGDLFMASASSTLLTYLLCGLIGLTVVLLGPAHFRCKGAALHTFPYALFWVPSIVLFSFCLGRLGTVYGNIIQASRGLLAIFFVQLLNLVGLYKVDGKATALVVARRLLAALLVIAAAALYNFHHA